MHKIPLSSLLFIFLFGCSVPKVKTFHLDEQTFNKYEMFKNNPAKKDLASTYLWNRQTKTVDTVWVKGSDVLLGDSKVRINLIDKNGDGTYNESEVDGLLLSQYGKDTVFINPDYSKLSPLKSQITINIDSKAYTIKDIHENGKSLSIAPVADVTIKNTEDNLHYHSTITGITIESMKGDKVSLAALREKDKLLYIDLWHARCKPCLKLLPEIDSLNSTMKEKVTFIALNTADDTCKIEKVREKLQLKMPIYRIENKALGVFDFTQLYPMGILYDQNGQLVDKIMYFDMKS